jgi:hypothetical protein
MTTEPANPKDFVSNWLEQAKANTKLNQDMIALLAESEKNGTDEVIFKSLLKTPLKKDVANDVH